MPLKKDKLLYIAVVVLLFGLAATGLALRWDDLVESGVFDPQVPPPPPATPAGNEPDDHSIYALVSNPASCAAPDPEIERIEIESTAPPEEALPEITKSVEAIREIPFEKNVPSKFLDAEEFTSLLERKLDKGAPTTTEAQTYSKLYEMLGAIEPGTNLQEELEKFYTDQISGLYLPKKDRLLVSTSGSELTPSQETVLAHELDHALTDQAIGIPELGKIIRKDEDRGAATQALVEGDATLLQTQYATSAMSFERLQALQEEFANPPESPEVPYIVEKSIGFPYDEGLRFACYLYLDGGWDAITDAYEDLPSSTADILFPHRYIEGIEPEDPKDPADPGKDWKSTQGNTFGAAELLFLIQAPEGTPMGTPGDVAGDVLDWNGGEYSIFENEKTKEVAIYIGLVEGGEKVVPQGVDPYPLNVVMTSWILMNWPGIEPKVAEGLGGSLTWTVGETTYVFSEKGKEVGLAAGPNFKVAAALLPK